MPQYEILHARTALPTGEEFLLCAIPSEHYQNLSLRRAWQAHFARFPLRVVTVGAGAASEYGLSGATDLLDHLRATGVDHLDWRYMPVDLPHPPPTS